MRTLNLKAHYPPKVTFPDSVFGVTLISKTPNEPICRSYLLRLRILTHCDALCKTFTHKQCFKKTLPQLVLVILYF